MDGVGAVRLLLVNDAALTALVPASQIVGGVLPSGVTFPAIRLWMVSGTHNNMFSPGDKRPMSQRIQVEVHGNNEVEAREIMGLVRSAADYQMPSTPGLTNVVVLLESQGPSGISADTYARVETQDLRVNYNEDR